MKDLTAEFNRLAASYEQIEQLIKHIATGSIRGLIVNGPPGVGKSFMVDQYLSAYKTGSQKTVKGSMTPLSLYLALYKHRNKGQVLVLDDVDSVLGKIEGLNLLKAAMDTQTQRRVSWESTTFLLTDTPRNFEFNGSVILVTNVGFGESARRQVAHLNALADRSFIVKIADGGRESAFAQIAYMVLEKGLLDAYSLTEAVINELLEFMLAYLEQLNTVSLRTATKIADLYTLDSKTWRQTAIAALMGAK